MDGQVERKRLYVPAAAGWYEALAPYSYTLIRVALGLILIPHGFNKLFLNDAVSTSRNFVNFGWAYPLAWAYFIGVLEFFGGILMVIGLWTRAVALAFFIQMCVIAFAVLWPKWFWGQRGMEYVVLMGVVSLAILWRGAGKLAVDNLLKKEF
jgi:putative oxidoreductase